MTRGAVSGARGHRAAGCGRRAGRGRVRPWTCLGSRVRRGPAGAQGRRRPAVARALALSSAQLSALSSRECPELHGAHNKVGGAGERVVVVGEAALRAAPVQVAVQVQAVVTAAGRAEVRSGQVRSGQVRSGQTGTGRSDRCGELRSGQVRSGQVR